MVVKVGKGSVFCLLGVSSKQDLDNDIEAVISCQYFLNAESFAIYLPGVWRVTEGVWESVGCL